MLEAQTSKGRDVDYFIYMMISGYYHNLEVCSDSPAHGGPLSCSV